jgi:OOP family OmpA-OmpF porin
MKLKSIFGLLLIGVIANGSELLAREGQGYLGVGYSESDYNLDTLSEPEDREYQFYLGNRYTRSWGVELGYTKFGDAEINSATDEEADTDTATETATVEGKTISLCLKYFFPIIKNLDAYATVGIHAWSLDVNNAELFNSSSENGSDQFYGGGLTYALTGKYNITLNYAKYNLDFGNDNDLDIDVTSLNFEWKTQ